MKIFLIKVTIKIRIELIPVVEIGGGVVVEILPWGPSGGLWGGGGLLGGAAGRGGLVFSYKQK